MLNTFLLFLLLLNLGALSVHLGFVVGCHETERDALLKFKHSLVHLNHSLSSWQGMDCCKWEGVGCDNVTSHINHLDLHNPYYQSYLNRLNQYNPIHLPCGDDSFTPESLHYIEHTFVPKPRFLIAPRLDSSLVELKHLNYLDLSQNEFQGSQIPEFIGSFKHLRYLNLSHSSFYGAVPSKLGNLTKLKILDLSSNNLYSTNLDWVSNLVSLQYLNMGGINISQSRMLIPMAPSLSSVRLSNCGLTIPQLLSLFSNFSWVSRIQQLDISDNSLEGPLPRVISNMTSLTHLNLAGNWFNGSIPLSMRNIRHLRYLDLSRNWFNGVEEGELMSILGSLCNLKTFDLSFNGFEERSIGTNHSISNITSLTYLDLSSNNFWGSIPLSMRNMKKLEHLDLSYNSFSHVEGGDIMGILGNLCKLKTFYLRSNLVRDGMGANHNNISKCVSYDLENLWLDDNQISGTLPSWLSEFKYLSYLDISKNRINGSIPIELGSLSHMRMLDLSSNFLEGVISEQHLANLPRLSTLDLCFNPNLDLNFSANWSPPFQLSELNMRSCKVQSQFPRWIERQTELYSLDLSDNVMTGELPQLFPNINLRRINMSHNNISGPIPYFSSSILFSIDLSYNLLSGQLLHDDLSSKKKIVGTPICQLPSLGFLDLERNEINGSLHDCWGYSEDLRYINLSSNNLSGIIPWTMGLLPNLGFLKLSDNFLQGPIPQTLSVKLQILDLGENKLVGNIPSNWGKTTHPFLEMLFLRGNQLVGVIPPTLCSLPKLQLLDLAHNKLTGSIPRCFGHLNGMRARPSPDLIEDNVVEPLERTSAPGPVDVFAPVINNNPREDTTTVVLKGAELQYTTTLMYVVNLDLSCNALVGSIPEEITNLSFLIGLNLSHNLLTGNIPNKIGEMRSLESLDLSNNNLSGTIPSSLSDITSLIALNLSYNKLHGKIPTGRQLQTLNDPSSYKGNLGLCGDPLPKCKTDHVENQPVGSYDPNSYWDNPLFYFVIFSGFATGFWGVVGSLLLKRRFRWALFQLVENITDYLYVQVMIKLNRHRN